MFDWTKDPHRRFNPLTREWVLVSPHRTERPWQGQMEAGATATGHHVDALKSSANELATLAENLRQQISQIRF